MKTQDFLAAIAESLNRSPGSLKLEDTPDTIEEWDSVGHLSILSTVEEKLGFLPDGDEYMSLSSIQELVDLLKARGDLED